MTLKEELDALRPMLGNDTPEFYDRVDKLSAKYHSEEDKKLIAAFIREELADIDSRLCEMKENALKLQLQEVTEIVSMSYLAKTYFNKSRAWLHQRINGNLVNGKPARFTPDELDTFNFALKDISRRIGSLSISL